MSGILMPQMHGVCLLAVQERPTLASWQTMQTRSSIQKGFLLVSQSQYLFRAREEGQHHKVYCLLCKYSEGRGNPFQT